MRGFLRLLVIGAVLSPHAAACALAEDVSTFVPAPVDADSAHSLVKGVLARCDAVFSGRLKYHMTGAFTNKPLHHDCECLFTFSWPSWALHYVDEGGGSIVTHKGKRVEFARSARDEQGNPRHIAHVAMPMEIKATWPYPPFHAGTIWHNNTRMYISRNATRARLGGKAQLDGVAVQVIEWDVSSEDRYRAFHLIGPMLQQGGTLRLYVAPQLGFALPLIEHIAPNGKPHQRFSSSEFSEDAPGIYFPRRFELKTFDATGPTSYLAFDIHEVLQLNQPIPDSEFKLSFPKGTSVADGRSGVGSLVFRVGEDPVPTQDLDDVFITPGGGGMVIAWWLQATLVGILLAAICVVVHLLLIRRRASVSCKA
jgi:hypothetical protein